MHQLQTRTAHTVMNHNTCKLKMVNINKTHFRGGQSFPVLFRISRFFSRKFSRHFSRADVDSCAEKKNCQFALFAVGDKSPHLTLPLACANDIWTPVVWGHNLVSGRERVWRFGLVSAAPQLVERTRSTRLVNNLTRTRSCFYDYSSGRGRRSRASGTEWMTHVANNRTGSWIQRHEQGSRPRPVGDVSPRVVLSLCSGDVRACHRPRTFMGCAASGNDCIVLST